MTFRRLIKKCIHFTNKVIFHSLFKFTHNSEMQLTVGPVGPRGQNFRGSGKLVLVTSLCQT